MVLQKAIQGATGRSAKDVRERRRRRTQQHLGSAKKTLVETTKIVRATGEGVGKGVGVRVGQKDESKGRPLCAETPFFHFLFFFFLAGGGGTGQVKALCFRRGLHTLVVRRIPREALFRRDKTSGYEGHLFLGPPPGAPPNEAQKLQNAARNSEDGRLCVSTELLLLRGPRGVNPGE